MDQPGKVANPARGQLNREINNPLSPCVPENLVSRGGFSRPVPRQPAHFHTQAESGAYLRDSSRVPPLHLFYFFTGIGIPIPGIVYFICDSASEFEAMGSTSLLGFSYPNLLLVFLNLLFLGTCIIFSRKCWDFLWVFFIFIVIFLYLILG